MHLLNEIHNLKRQLLNKIANCVSSENTDDIIHYSKIIEELKEAENSYFLLKKIIENLKKKSLSSRSQEEKNNLYVKDKKMSAKALGERRRKDFILKAKNKSILLNQVNGVQYSTYNHDLVGIATATERIPNRWFLGLPKGDYSIIVLICEDNNNETHTFILPKHLVKKHINDFSCDAKRQIKFNISKYLMKFSLSIPKFENIEINGMQNNFDNFN